VSTGFIIILSLSDDAAARLAAIVFMLLFVLPLLCSQFLALWSYRTGKTTLARWALAVCLLLIIAAVVLEVPEQFTPATYERQRIRQSAFFAHVLLVGIEVVVIFLMACFSTSRLERLNFWIVWWLSLALITAFFSVYLYSLSGPAI